MEKLTKAQVSALAHREVTALIAELDAALAGHPGPDNWWRDCSTIRARLAALLAALPEREG